MQEKVKVKMLNCLWLFATPLTVAYQIPPPMGFSRQEYWSGLPFPSPGDLPNPGVEPGSPTLQADTLPSEPPGKSCSIPGSGRPPGEGIGYPLQYSWASPCGSAGRESTRNAGDLGSIPGLGRSPGEGNGNPLQYPCLENPMDGGAWWATVHGVAESRTQLSDFTHSMLNETRKS